MENSTYQYDVALSFAGEDRDVAEALSKLLESMGLSVFYDKSEQADLWGSNLIEKLQYVYRDAARHCIVCASHHYASKRWTRHELKQVQERAFRDCGDYILPLRLDDTPIPGINETTGYVDARHVAIGDIARLVYRKVKGVDYHGIVAATEPDLCPPPPRSHNGIAVSPSVRKHLSDVVLAQMRFIPNFEAASSIQLGQAGLWDWGSGQWRRSALGMIDEYFATDMPSRHALANISFSSNLAISSTGIGELSLEFSGNPSFLLAGKGWRTYSLDLAKLHERISDSSERGLHWPSELMIVTEVVVADSTTLIWAETPNATMKLRSKSAQPDAVHLDQIDASCDIVSCSGSVGCELDLRSRTPLFRVVHVKKSWRGGRVTLRVYP